MIGICYLPSSMVKEPNWSTYLSQEVGKARNIDYPDELLKKHTAAKVQMSPYS